MAEPSPRLAAALADRYRLDRELGQGGMATVYLAHDLRNNRKVALKVLRPELAAILGAERFLKEIETTANLQHPHILPLFDSGEAGGAVFYVMPYVEGESLRDRLTREHQLPVDEAVRIAKEVADALDYAHRHGVIHRDVKPENILLHDGRVQVADFGIALAVSRTDGSGRMTETGMSLGTPHYMAPEQAMGQREITPRADIYALGCVLYEMLIGEPPFTGPTAQAIIARVMTEEPRSLTLQRKTIPPQVEAAVLGALQKLPADRFASAAEVVAALDGKATVTSVRGTGTAASGRNLHLPLMIATGVAMAAIALALWGWFRPMPSRPVIRYRLGIPAEHAVDGTVAMPVAISPDGRSLVYASVGVTGPLWIRDRDRLDAELLAGTEGAFSPFFSPDGRQVGFLQTGAYTLMVMPATGGPPITLEETTAGGGAAWSTDGWIYFDSPSGFKRVPSVGGTAALVVPLDTAHGEVGLAWPDVVPGGQGLLLRSRRNSNPQDYSLISVDLRTGHRHQLGKGILARYLPPGYLLIARSDGVLMAAPFDRDHLEPTGPAVPVLEGIETSPIGSVGLAISAEGTLVYTIAATGTPASAEVVSVGRDGSIQSLRPPLQLTPAAQRGLALSPDGTRLALDVANGKSTDIWIKQLPSGPFSRLTFEGSTNVRPSWTSNGNSVLFVSDRGATSHLAPWRQRADGGAPAEPLPTGTTHEIRSADLSHDGEWLVYHEYGDSGWDIRAIHLGQDSTAIPLLTGRFNEFAPELSPDGQWLAYISDESGVNEVYVRPFPRVGKGRWQISTGGGIAARWAHSGRELFYQGPANEEMVVNVTLAPSFAAGIPHKLFDAVPQLYPSSGVPYYDVTPDDRRFIMVRSSNRDQNPGPSQIVVVENFREEVRRKLSAAGH